MVLENCYYCYYWNERRRLLLKEDQVLDDGETMKQIVAWMDLRGWFCCFCINIEISIFLSEGSLSTIKQDGKQGKKKWRPLSGSS